MNYLMTVCIADDKLNEFMRAADLKPDHKEYIKFHEVSFSTTTKVDENYFMKVINMSKNSFEDYWIPAIIFSGVTYNHKDVKILSDGTKEYFCGTLDKVEEVKHK